MANLWKMGAPSKVVPLRPSFRCIECGGLGGQPTEGCIVFADCERCAGSGLAHIDRGELVEHVRHLIKTDNIDPADAIVRMFETMINRGK